MVKFLRFFADPDGSYLGSDHYKFVTLLHKAIFFYLGNKKNGTSRKHY